MQPGPRAAVAGALRRDAPLVHVWVEDFVDEADGGRLVRIRLRQLHCAGAQGARLAAGRWCWVLRQAAQVPLWPQTEEMLDTRHAPSTSPQRRDLRDTSRRSRRAWKKLSFYTVINVYKHWAFTHCLSAPRTQRKTRTSSPPPFPLSNRSSACKKNKHLKKVTRADFLKACGHGWHAQLHYIHLASLAWRAHVYDCL